MSSQDRLLSDEELDLELLDMWSKWESGNWFVSEEDDDSGKYNDRRFREAIVNLINTQKRLYAESEKFELEKKFRTKVVAPVVDYLIDNPHYPIEAEIRREVFDQQSEALYILSKSS